MKKNELKETRIFLYLNLFLRKKTIVFDKWFKEYLILYYNSKMVRKNTADMSILEAQAFVENIRQRNRDAAKKHYDNKIKNDPAKYHLWLAKCQKANKTYYDKTTIWVFDTENFSPLIVE